MCIEPQCPMHKLEHWILLLEKGVKWRSRHNRFFLYAANTKGHREISDLYLNIQEEFLGDIAPAWVNSVPLQL